MTVRGVIFDIGGTIMWLQHRRFIGAGAWALSHYLGGLGILPKERFKPFSQELESHFAASSKEGPDYSQINTTASILEAVVEADGHAPADGELALFEQVFNAPAVAGAVPLPGMIVVIEALRGRVRLGVASNTRSHQFIEAVATRFGLHDAFDPLVTSVSCGIRKPGAGIFQAVLDSWGFGPDEVVMVGDLAHKDVAGAKALGLRTIWLTTDADEQRDDHGADAVVSAPAAILDVLRGWGLPG